MVGCLKRQRKKAYLYCQRCAKQKAPKNLGAFLFLVHGTKKRTNAEHFRWSSRKSATAFADCGISSTNDVPQALGGLDRSESAEGGSRQEKRENRATIGTQELGCFFVDEIFTAMIIMI